jgi:hypothetical protein
MTVDLLLLTLTYDKPVLSSERAHSKMQDSNQYLVMDPKLDSTQDRQTG